MSGLPNVWRVQFAMVGQNLDQRRLKAWESSQNLELTLLEIENLNRIEREEKSQKSFKLNPQEK